MEETTTILEPRRTDSLNGMSPESKIITENGMLPSEERRPLPPRIITQGVNTAMMMIKNRYEASPDPVKRLSFHNRVHSLEEIRRTQLILKAIHDAAPDLVTERDILLSTIPAAFHDTEQIEDPNEFSNGNTQRKRIFKKCEEGSVKNAFAFMDEVNTREPGTFYKKEKTTTNHIPSDQNGNMTEQEEKDDYEIVNEAIMGTVPGWNGKTVVQPNLAPESNLIAHAVAFADINTIGLEDTDMLLYEAVSLFRENNIDILAKARDGSFFTESDFAEIKQRITAWFGVQLGFIKGRYEVFETELNKIEDERARNAIRGVFTGFQTNAFERTYKKMENDFLELQELPTIQLLETVGYQVFQSDSGYRLYIPN
jgi:hypothetical protein